MKILFFPQRSKIRLYKIARAVQEIGGIEAVLVCSKSYYDVKLFRGLFTEVYFYIGELPFEQNVLFKILYRKIKERSSFGFKKLREVIDKCQPDLIHAFCEPYNHIEFVLKEFNIPVVMSDGADFSGISSGIDVLPNWVRTQERYCLENVDGICHKGPVQELDYYRKHDYAINCPEITWMDYCDKKLFAKGYKMNTFNDEDEIHVVYTGLVSENPNVYYINYLSLAKSFALQKIHFHIYANPDQLNSLQKYIDLNEQEEYFHFHRSRKYIELIEDISNYDYGLWWHEPRGEDRFRSFKQEVSIGNKFYTYLEAGLPVIVGDNLLHGSRITKDYKLGVVVNQGDLNNLREKLAEFDSESLIKNVKEGRVKLSIESQAGALGAFYKKVLEQRASTST